MKQLLLCLLPLLPLAAQMPSECLLIVNGSSPEALRVANEYRDLRKIPSQRVITLLPPRSLFRDVETDAPRWSIREAEARENLLDPILQKLEALADPSPTALIFSPDWPTRVILEAGESVSLTAYIGFRGKMPEAAAIKSGSARAPWFIAPEELRQPGTRLPRYPAPDMLAAGQHPAMMLGVLHEPLDAESIVLALRRAAGADFTRPQGSVAIITNTDVRTTARLPQFAPAKERLEARKIPVLLDSIEAPLPEALIGVMTGAANVDTARYAGKLLPGAFAEHLTSHAATFDNAGQTKLTRWIAAGAAGSAGTITEPYAIWVKFPHAAVFERYTLGNTLLEAITQSVGSPFQSLAVGDPLCRPWAEPMKTLELKTEWKGNRLRIEARGMPAGAGVDLHLYADGQRVPGNGPLWDTEWTSESAGPELHLQLFARHLWTPPILGHAEQRVKTPFPKTIDLEVRAKDDLLRLDIRTTETLVHWELCDGPRVLHREAMNGRRARAEIPQSLTGAGPLRLHLRGISASGRIHLSPEESIEVPPAKN